MARSRHLHILDRFGRKIPLSMLSDYEGSTTGRRMQTWGLSTAGPSAVVSYNLSSLRSRSRELIRNNAITDGGVDSFVASIIGSGISPRWTVEERERLLELWNDWVDEADVYGRLSFYGLQSLASRAMIDAGEVLCRFIRRERGRMNTVPLQLQLLEADHLDEAYTTIAPNGNQVRLGIEVDPIGVPLAYWLWPEHPGEHYILHRYNFERVRVEAADVLHMFKPLRAGQMRGRPWLSSVIVKLHDLDQYDDAELVRKKGAAMFGGFIEQAENTSDEDVTSDEILGNDTGEVDDNEDEIIALEPGTYVKLPKGFKVNFSTPVDVGSSYESWMKQQLRFVAKGIGVTYEQLTGDLTGVNYSSIRAGINDLKRRVTQLQQEIIIFQFCRPVINEWLHVAYLNGMLDFTRYRRNHMMYRRVIWNPDAWPSVNPLEDAQTDRLEVRSGLASRARKVAARGEDVEDIDREQKADHDRETELGLVYETNAESVTNAGIEVFPGSAQREAQNKGA